MSVVMNREQLRAYERHAIEVCHVPSLVLMENAGRGAAELIAPMMQERSGPAVIVCGRGNNGGDGLVVARQLAARGLEADVFLVGTRGDVAADARVNLTLLEGLGVSVEELGEDLDPLREALADASVCVDALFGTGLGRDLEGVWRAIVEVINSSCLPVVALDIPSGIDSTSGKVLGAAIKATVTVTFGQHKTGLMQADGIRHAGKVCLVGLGIPDSTVLPQLPCEAEIIDATDVLLTCGAREPALHKYRAGSVLLVAGSLGKTGAAVLAASAALRSGAGLATIATWPDAADRIEASALEVMTARLDRQDLSRSLAELLQKRAAVGIGPGLGLDADARRVVLDVVLSWPGPVVVDADALSQFAGRPEDLKQAAGVRILTPHEGELARLLAVSAEEIQGARFALARHAAVRTGSIVVLKGPYTIVAHPEQLPCVADVLEPLLATAGSGDVLTGMLTALAVHADSLDAAFCAARAGVHLHAASARSWKRRMTVDGRAPDRGMLAGDLLAEIPRAIAAV